jgi:hypothetical protein
MYARGKGRLKDLKQFRVQSVVVQDKSQKQRNHSSVLSSNAQCVSDAKAQGKFLKNHVVNVMARVVNTDMMKYV